MKTKEPGQRGAGYVVAASQKTQHWPSHYGNYSCDFGSDFGGKKSELIPGKQVTAETKRNDDEQKKHAADPGDFSWRIVSAQKEHAEHVNEQRGNHQVRRPAVNRANQPTELYFGDD